MNLPYAVQNIKLFNWMNTLSINISVKISHSRKTTYLTQVDDIAFFNSNTASWTFLGFRDPMYNQWQNKMLLSTYSVLAYIS